MKKKTVLPEKNIETIITAFGFDNESGQASTSTRIWQQYGYFNQQLQLSDFNMAKKIIQRTVSSISIKHI